jgi:hypothetical protein
MIVEPASPATVDLADVVDRLRELLRDDPASRALNPEAMASLETLLAKGAAAERLLLPRRLTRALDQMGSLTRTWARQARDRGDWLIGDRWENLRQLVDSSNEQSGEGPPAARDVALRWLQLIRPVLEGHRPSRRRVPFVLLNDITPSLIEDPLEIESVEAAFAEVPVAAPFAERVSACILGVP